MDSVKNDTAAKQPHVGLFVTCLVDMYRPNVGFATLRLLEDAGCKVSVPPSQTCCGQPAFNSGETKNAATIARNTITAFADFDYIVAPSGSCAGMLKHHYPELLQSDKQWSEKAMEFSSRVYELTQFLADVIKTQSISAGLTEKVTYHDSCSSLREMEVSQQPRDLLAQVQGVELTELADTQVCCGFGGTFCVKYPDISERMLTDKVALIEQSGADVLLAGDMGCLLNLTGRLSRLNKSVRSYHVAEVLAGMADGPGIGEPDKNDPHVQDPISDNESAESHGGQP